MRTEKQMLFRLASLGFLPRQSTGDSSVGVRGAWKPRLCVEARTVASGPDSIEARRAGRLNVSPARKGWVRFGGPWERQRRGTHILLNQSAAWKPPAPFCDEYILNKRWQGPKAKINGTQFFRLRPRCLRNEV